MKRRERQKIAEQNRLDREKTNFDLEAETQRILNKLKDVDMTKVKERERQLEKIQAKLKGRQIPQKNDKEVANEIMENYSETNAVLVIFEFIIVDFYQRKMYTNVQTVKVRNPGHCLK